jgi:hypothetical protein
MESTVDEVAIDEQAARLMLVALAGMVPSYEALDAGRIRISPDEAILSVDEAARLLASMPKPLICFAENVGGTLDVTCDLLAETVMDEQERFDRRRGLSGGSGALFAHLADGDGHAERQMVAAFGRTEKVVVSLAAAERWFRDYEIDFPAWRADDPANPRERDNPIYDESRKLGAKGLLRFDSIASRIDTVDGARFPFPLPKSASADDRRKVERTLIEMAKHFLVVINDEEDVWAVEREMVERGELPADSFSEHGRNRDRYLQHVLASQMRHFFDGRAMPAEVTAFLDACRGD